MDNDEKGKVLKKFREFLSKSSMYTEEESSLISNTFVDNEDLIMAIRKHFFQVDLLTHEKALLDDLEEGVLAVLRKTYLPQVDPEISLIQTGDLWTSVDTKEKLAEDVKNDLTANLILIRYFEQQFDKMTGIEKSYDYAVKDSENQWENGNIQLKDLIFTGTESTENAFANMQARNMILIRVDSLIHRIRTLAVQLKTKLTPKEMEEKLKWESNK